MLDKTGVLPVCRLVRCLPEAAVCALGSGSLLTASSGNLFRRCRLGTLLYGTQVLTVAFCPLCGLLLALSQGGVFGAVAASDDFIAAITPPVAKLAAAGAQANGDGHPAPGPVAVVPSAKPYEYRFAASK